MNAPALFGESRDGAMGQADINRAIRSLAYLKTPDKVRAGVRNTYGVTVALERVSRILKVVQAEGQMRAADDPLPNDAFDYDVRVHPNARRKVIDEIAQRNRPAFRERAPLPKSVPAPTANPFEGPFQFKVLAASVARDFDTTADAVCSALRLRKLILPRIVLTRLCIEQGMSCSNIGRKMGDRDHTTILHQRDKFEPYAALYPTILVSYHRHVALRSEAQAAREAALAEQGAAA